MLIDIKQHSQDSDMYELWQVVDGKPKYLMSVVHGDVLDSDVNPGAFDENQIRVEMYFKTEPIDKPCPYCLGSGIAFDETIEDSP